jgi:hypothetical protein
MSTTQDRTDLRGYVLADGAVSALIAARFYAVLAAKEPAFPYAVCSHISAGADYSHGTGEPAFREDLYQVDIFSVTAAGAQAVCDAIRVRVEGKKFTHGSTDFGAVFVDTEFDSFEDVVRDDGRAGIYRKTLQLRILINP